MNDTHKACPEPPDDGWCFVRWDNGVESYGSTAFLRREVAADVAPKSRAETTGEGS